MLLSDLNALQNIIDLINPKEDEDDYFNESEINDIFNECLHLIDTHFKSEDVSEKIDSNNVDEVDFIKNTLLDEMLELFESSFEHDIFYNECACEVLCEIILFAINYYFEFILFASTVFFNNNASNDCNDDVSNETNENKTIAIVQTDLTQKEEPRIMALTTQQIAQQIVYLESKPQPTQRTEEWYVFRHNLITASNAYKAFESQSAKNQLIYEKCKPIVYGKQHVSVTSPLHWGQKYEPISVLYYEHTYKTTIKDFGCIQHDKYPFLGASPDGINVDPTTSYYGRMLEIKNPVSREITGIPKKEYWVQMQLQMETCNLDECDFLETKFVEYENEDAFQEDGTFLKSAKNELKGVMMYFSDNENSPRYVYKPLTMDDKEFQVWEAEMIELYENDKNMTWIKNNYWKLQQVSCILVKRDRPWFESHISELSSLWDIVETERASGYEHRAPKSRAKQTPQSNQIQVNKIGPSTSESDSLLSSSSSSSSSSLFNFAKPIKKLMQQQVQSSGCLLNIKTDKMTGEVTVVLKS